MELLSFGHAGASVLVFPTRQGRFFDFENWGLVDAIRHSIEAGQVRLYCVDSVDSESFYCRDCPAPNRIARHNRYERYILDEVIPLMRNGCHSTFLIAHGCSLGAYHAMNIVLRHPGVFGKVVAPSGRFDLTRAIGPFEDLFQGHYDEDIYFHTPEHFLPGLRDSDRLHHLRRTEIHLAVGESDPFRPSNQILSGELWRKNVPHGFAIWEGEAHRASAWRQMLPNYL